MKPSRWIALVVLVVLIAGGGALVALPRIARHVAVARLEAITHRHVRIDRVELNLLTGRVAVVGLHVSDRAPGSTLADWERLDLRFSPLSLLRGDLWIREAVLRGSTVRIVRSPEGLNVADLVGGAPTGTVLDVTVDHFALVDGTLMLEDRAITPPRTWTSEHIAIDARNVSTRDQRGVAEASSVTGGAPVAIKFEHFQLYPIHFDSQVTITGVDLSVARLYLPPDAPAVLERGRTSMSLRVSMDARRGVHASGTGELEDLVVVAPKTGEKLFLAPRMTSRLTDFAYEADQIAVGEFDLAGSASVLNPRARGGPRFEASTLHAGIANLTWPVRTDARIELQSSVPGGGTALLSGSVRPPPAASQLRLRLAKVNLAPWARFIPVAARISGTAESDLRVDEPLAAGVPAHVRGTIAVNDLGVRDEHREVMAARRVEASGLEVQWPTRVVAKRVLVTSPRAIVERDQAGELSLLRLMAQPTPPAASTSASPTPGRLEGEAGPRSTERSPRASAGEAGPSVAVTIGEIAVRGGSLSWRDATVSPPAALELSAVDAEVTGAAWPLPEFVNGRVTARPPGGGQLEADGRVSLTPLAGDVRVRTKDADVAPYRPYLGTPAHVAGWADVDLVVHLPRTPDERLAARGSATLSRVDVRDEQRSVAKLERGVATGLDVVWPERVSIADLSLRRPWVLVERDEKKELTFKAVLPSTAPARATSNAPTATANAKGAAGNGLPDHETHKLVVTVRHVAVEEGGARVVDRSLSPAFAVDLSRLDVTADGLATASARPATVSVKGRVGAYSLLDLAGTVGPLEGPLKVDLNGRIQGFWMPRTDPYMLQYVGWEARDGWLTTDVRCRIDKGALDARTDIRLSRLSVVKASRDEAQRRIGLPLGMIVALMKDRRGDIRLTLPVGGRLSDPRFDYSEAIWSTVRNASIKAITLPVSWIGHVKLTPDSRIEQIQVDPVRFPPGTAALSSDGQAQVSRLIQFFQHAPETRMKVTPYVSEADVTALKRQALDRELARVGGDAKNPNDAARKLFQQRFPDRAVPENPDAVLSALLDGTALPNEAVSQLAAQRVNAVKAAAKKGGVDSDRLPEGALVEGPNARDSEVALDLAEPAAPEKRERGLPGLLKRLGATRETPAGG